MYNVSPSFVVQLEYAVCASNLDGAEEALDAGICEARKFARKEFMSSILDFSVVGRRITEGPPFIILLGWIQWEVLEKLAALLTKKIR